MKSKEKLNAPAAPFTIGEMVAYDGRKPKYFGKVGLVFKVKTDACHVQFFDDPVTLNGGPKTFRLSFKDLRQHRPANPSIPKPQLLPPDPPLP